MMNRLDYDQTTVNIEKGKKQESNTTHIYIYAVYIYILPTLIKTVPITIFTTADKYNY